MTDCDCADRQHPVGHTEVGEQHVDVAEDAEVESAEAVRFDEQQQVLAPPSQCR